jgi:hypothetical protein
VIVELAASGRFWKPAHPPRAAKCGVYAVRDMSYWADVASIACVFLTLAGFVITIWNVQRSKNAAERAEEAAQHARDSIMLRDTIGDLAAATTAFEEIKRLHRSGAWPILPDRYSSLRTSLVRILHSNQAAPENVKTALVGAIQQLTQMEKSVERALAADGAPKDFPRLNRIISEATDELNAALAEIKRGP